LSDFDSAIPRFESWRPRVHIKVSVRSDRETLVEFSDLVNEPWVLPPPESGFGSVVMKAFRASGLNYPRTTVIGEPAELRMSLLATGRFISIFPNSVFRFSGWRPKLQVLPIKQSIGHVPVGIVLLKSRTTSPLAQLFIKSCRELAKQPAKKIR
jgi:DNA-binding transcriptional LysR family regulator